MYKSLKRAFLRVSKDVSMLRRVANSEWRRQRLAILCYHGVALTDEHEWDPRLFVAPATLEHRFQILRDGGYHVLPLDEGLRRLYDGSLPPRSVAITFDDGCYDFYHNALPLLTKYQFPATLYLTTFYCRYPKPVFNMMCFYLLWKGRNFSGRRLLDLDLPAKLDTEEKRLAAGEAIVASVSKRRLTLTERDALYKELARQLDVDYEKILEQRILQLMTPVEVAKAAASGLVDVQLHTHRHRTPSDRELFLREIRDNRNEIHAMAGVKSTTHFCYPSGVYQKEFLPWLKEEGVIYATTCESGLASPSDHRLLLPRVIDTNGLSDLEFEGWVAGLSQRVSLGRESPAVRLALAYQ